MIDFLVEAYFIIALLSFAVVFIVVYLLAIEEKGVVIGGTLGVFPAGIVGFLCALLWPIVLGVFIFNRFIL